MSIYAYTGMPGSGKSYDVVANQIMPALKAGRKVVTNVPLHLDVVRQVCPDADLADFPVEQISAAPELIDDYVVPGCVLVIDECWRLWPSGQKAHQVPEPFKKLLAEHRHMVDAESNSMQIVLVTQDLAQIGMFARQLVEQTFHHTKLTHVGAQGSYRIDVYQGPQTGANPPKGARLREVFGRYQKEVFKLYKSHTMSQAGKDGANERAIDKRGNIWRRPMLWVAAAGCIVAFVWGGRAAYSTFHKKGDDAPAGASGATPGPARPLPSSGTAARSPSPIGPRAFPGAPSPEWRITGLFRVDAEPLRSRAFLSDGARSVSVSFARFCLVDQDGEPVCNYRDLRVTRFGIIGPVEVATPAKAAPTAPLNQVEPVLQVPRPSPAAAGASRPAVSSSRSDQVARAVAPGSLEDRADRSLNPLRP